MSAVVTGSDTVVVSWNPSSSGMCDVLSADEYSIRYHLSCSTGGYATVNTSSTSVTLQNLAPNSQYDVEVAAINSNGAISDFSTVAQFMTPDTTPSKIATSPCMQHPSSHLAVCCTVNQHAKSANLADSLEFTANYSVLVPACCLFPHASLLPD